eukprot:m.27336 g.27336  ORF g.27336 m.27336 type:complete len:502 (-) comp13414_c0_seq1:1792-3297(-)
MQHTLHPISPEEEFAVVQQVSVSLSNETCSARDFTNPNQRYTLIPVGKQLRFHMCLETSAHGHLSPECARCRRENAKFANHPLQPLDTGCKSSHYNANRWEHPRPPKITKLVESLHQFKKDGCIKGRPAFDGVKGADSSMMYVKRCNETRACAIIRRWKVKSLRFTWLYQYYIVEDPASSHSRMSSLSIKNDEDVIFSMIQRYLRIARDATDALRGLSFVHSTSLNHSINPSSELTSHRFEGVEENPHAEFTNAFGCEVSAPPCVNADARTESDIWTALPVSVHAAPVPNDPELLRADKYQLPACLAAPNCSRIRTDIGLGMTGTDVIGSIHSPNPYLDASSARLDAAWTPISNDFPTQALPCDPCFTMMTTSIDSVLAMTARGSTLDLEHHHRATVLPDVTFARKLRQGTMELEVVHDTNPPCNASHVLQLPTQQVSCTRHSPMYNRYLDQRQGHATDATLDDAIVPDGVTMHATRILLHETDDQNVPQVLVNTLHPHWE